MKVKTQILIFLPAFLMGCQPAPQVPEQPASVTEPENMPQSEPSAAEIREIALTDMTGLKIGQCENEKAGTGLTVFISESGMAAGIDVRGGGPASRESQMLNPLMTVQEINAVVLSGGSAFGLGAADGVMKYLEEHDIGFDTGAAKVPLVVQADIYDLTVGSADIRPDAEMGYEAARRAFEEPNYRDGNYVAGCGASVGKIAGMDNAAVGFRSAFRHIPAPVQHGYGGGIPAELAGQGTANHTGADDQNISIIFHIKSS